ncbi:MAG: fumarylacetoacetate hydrolase family protein [Actinomycetota bacterium]|nr:fumarylacetoacetate hydrolase family protein [Actinomycetota bacterium]
MRLATVASPDGPRLVVASTSGTGYVDVAEATGIPRYRDLNAVLGEWDVAQRALGEAAARPGVSVAPGEFAPAVPAPRRVLCLGVNYAQHAIERGSGVPSWPECFVRGPDSVAAPYGELRRPALSERFDFEGELGVVIAKSARLVRRERALEVVAGYVVLNDGSAREWQRAATQWTPGKNFDATMPIGPEIVTADELDASDLELTTLLNGEVMQHARTSQMIVDIPTTIEYLSSFTTLRPGDVIATGTPGGVGRDRTPPVFLTAGDLVEVSIEGIGTIANRVVDEDPLDEPWPWQPLGRTTAS